MTTTTLVDNPVYNFNGTHVHAGTPLWILFVVCIVAGLAGGAIMGLILYSKAALVKLK